uniref:Uncharacterized protein n=1 Tax=Grammatophora oceanica TaxID=210454 RepID=A0A7S1USX4_9STRA|mmetsp:Transcript_21162/g.31410  ORF Transcript_21162/g.31410 Transcript_21162/m.31410 type:complete len:106 (+) Transcript_21162:263-580(+)
MVALFLSRTAILLHQSSSNERRIQETIKTIMDRASLDMRYEQMYARLCGRLATSTVYGPYYNERMHHPTTRTNHRLRSCSNISFRQALRNECQESMSVSILYYDI